jgi:hypothetical protein
MEILWTDRILTLLDKILYHRLASTFYLQYSSTQYSSPPPFLMSYFNHTRPTFIYIYICICVCVFTYIYILTSINSMYSAPISCHNLLFYFIYFIRVTCCMCAYLSLVTAGRLLSMSSSSSKAFSLKSSILARVGQCSCYTQRYSVVYAM